jgi:hypothetical protein
LPVFDSVDVADESVERRWRVEAGLSVRGIARRSSGRALAGARIAVDPVANDPIEPGKRPLQSNCIADAEGRFECGGLVAGEYRCRLITESSASATSVTVTLLDGKDASVVLEAPASGTLLAVLPAEDGQTMAASVFAQREGERELFQASGQSPRFVLSDLPLGSYELFLGPPGLGGEAAGKATIAHDEQQVELVLQGGQTHTLRGIVLDSSGEPVPDAWVTMESDWDPDLSSGRPRALTDERGHFALSGAWSGRQRVSASSPLGEATVGGLRASANDVIVRLEARASLAGSVQTPSGQPVAQFSLEYLLNSSSGGAIRGHDGRFELSTLKAGSYALSVASSEGSAKVAEMVLAPGQRGEVVLTVQPN